MTGPDRTRSSARVHVRPSATGKERIVALDGIRAVALLIIMGYHFGVGWLQGGFFSLDIFYVLSGYLITGLLLGEYASRGRVVLSAFWLRRARRLFPALLVVLVVVTVLVRFAEPAGLYPDFRMSALSALFYFSNWWQIAASSNYFVITGAASPLTHTWSLAVEEQFYLVWPLVVLAVMHLSRSFTRGLRVLLALSVVGALASAVEMAVLDVRGADLTRLYFGTDTHAQSILIGSVVACTLTMIERRRGRRGMAPRATGRTARLLLTVVGLAGLAGTLVLTATMEGTSSFAYQGGFFLSALSAAALIVGAVCVEGGVIATGLSLRPLVWLGTISYGAYLWHYPVFVYLDASRTGQTGLSLLAVRFATTIALAEGSFILVERPVMEGTFWRSLKAVVPATALLGATVAVVVVGTVAPATAAVGVKRFPAGSATAPPPEVVVLGDSTGLALGYALEATAPPLTTVVDGGLFGCGLTVASYASNNPPKPELAMFPDCNSATPPNRQWAALDAVPVATTRPGDVVVFVAGDWESQDVLRDGRWTNIEQPSYRQYLLAQMRRAVLMGTAHGAHFDFTTMPAMASGAAFGGPPFPEDAPGRRLQYDSLIRTVAAEFPGRVSVIDYGKILSPHGVFTEYLDGVQIRSPDGVHTPAYDPGNVFVHNSSEAVAHAFYDWLSPRLWPAIIDSAANRTGESGAERQNLAATDAFSSHPVRFLLVGDSLAVTLSKGLGQGSAADYGVEVVNRGVLGCDLDDLSGITSGSVDKPESACRTWRALWGHDLAAVHPDVVGLLVGRWMIDDHIDDGRVVHVGQPAWDAHLTQELSQAVDVLSSAGARVVMFTLPYFDPPQEAPNGSTFPEDEPIRVNQFNGILTRVAADHPGVANLIDLNALVDPAGHFQTDVDGVMVRWADGIHITAAGGEWLQPDILPTVARLGLDVRAAAPTG